MGETPPSITIHHHHIARGEHPSEFRECKVVLKRVIAVSKSEAPSPPDLQQLVIDHGGYDKITPEGWAKFDEDMRLWKERMRNGDFTKAALSRKGKYADRRDVIKRYAT